MTAPLTDAQKLDGLLNPTTVADYDVEARREGLEAAGYAASEATVEFILRCAEKHRRGMRVSADGVAVIEFIAAFDAIDTAWRGFIGAGGHGAGRIVFEACEFWAGATVAMIVEAVLERFRAIDREWFLKHCDV